jgi:predicted metal-dependent peptidase
VRVLSCDAAAGVAVPLCRAESIPLIGGGGTDMRQGIERVLAQRPRPDVVVVLTDGETPWPDTQPACRMVVGRFARRAENRYEYVPPPDWARVVTIG